MRNKIFGFLAVLLLSAFIGFQGCSYAGVAMDGDTAIILQNDHFMAGMLRKVFVCKVDGTSLSCKAHQP